MQHTTQASGTLCRRCGAAILNAWDEGRLARVEPWAVSEGAAGLAEELGVPVFVLTAGRHLIQRRIEHGGGPPFGALHVRHTCRLDR